MATEKDKLEATYMYADKIFISRLTERIAYLKQYINLIEGVVSELEVDVEDNLPEGRTLNHDLTGLLNEITEKVEVLHDILLTANIFERKLRVEHSNYNINEVENNKHSNNAPHDMDVV